MGEVKKYGGKGNIDPRGGKKFSSTYQPGNNGRSKKLTTILRDSGSNARDIKFVFKNLAGYNLKELKELYQNEDNPIIIRIVCNQYFQALQKSDWSKIKEIMEYVLGKPNQQIQIEDATDQKQELDLSVFRDETIEMMMEDMKAHEAKEAEKV